MLTHVSYHISMPNYYHKVYQGMPFMVMENDTRKKHTGGPVNSFVSFAYPNGKRSPPTPGHHSRPHPHSAKQHITTGRYLSEPREAVHGPSWVATRLRPGHDMSASVPKAINWFKPCRHIRVIQYMYLYEYPTPPLSARSLVDEHELNKTSTMTSPVQFFWELGGILLGKAAKTILNPLGSKIYHLKTAHPKPKVVQLPLWLYVRSQCRSSKLEARCRGCAWVWWKSVSKKTIQRSHMK